MQQDSRKAGPLGLALSEQHKSHRSETAGEVADGSAEGWETEGRLRPDVDDTGPGSLLEPDACSPL